VDQAAQMLRDEGYELTPLLRTLLLSEAFFSDASRAGFVRAPIEMSVGFINSTGLVIQPRLLDAAVTAMGQRPTQPPTVNGWPGGEQWLSAQGMVDRANVVEACISARELQEALGIDVADLMPSGTPTSAEVVDAITDLLGVEPTPGEIQTYTTYLDTDREPNGTIVADPFDPTDPIHVDERLRGLLYVVSGHPQYHVR
jgi:hypothetical protein